MRKKRGKFAATSKFTSLLLFPSSGTMKALITKLCMLSIERVKELIKRDISDEEAKQIRDECRMLAEIIIAAWQHERTQTDTPESGDTAVQNPNHHDH